MKSTIKLSIIALTLTISSIACSQQRYAADQYDITEFSSIKSSVVGNISIRQTQNTSVSAEGNEEMLDLLEVKVDNGTLVLDMVEQGLKKLKRGNGKLNILITTPNLTYIDNKGVGNLVIEGIFNSPELTINSSGVGNTSIENIKAGSINVDSEGVGNITLIGTADNLDIESEGVGNIYAERLKTKSAFISSEGIGNVKCYASEYLKASAEGIGRITYFGNPKKTNLSKEGIGKIKSGD